MQNALKTNNSPNGRSRLSPKILNHSIKTAAAADGQPFFFIAVLLYFAVNLKYRPGIIIECPHKTRIEYVGYINFVKKFKEFFERIFANFAYAVQDLRSILLDYHAFLVGAFKKLDRGALKITFAIFAKPLGF